jgi:hypothetical protein
MYISSTSQAQARTSPRDIQCASHRLDFNTLYFVSLSVYFALVSNVVFALFLFYEALGRMYLHRMAFDYSNVVTSSRATVLERLACRSRPLLSPFSVPVSESCRYCTVLSGPAPSLLLFSPPLAVTLYSHSEASAIIFHICRRAGHGRLFDDAPSANPFP